MQHLDLFSLFVVGLIVPCSGDLFDAPDQRDMKKAANELIDAVLNSHRERHDRSSELEARIGILHAILTGDQSHGAAYVMYDEYDLRASLDLLDENVYILQRLQNLALELGLECKDDKIRFNRVLTQVRTLVDQTYPIGSPESQKLYRYTHELARRGGQYLSLTN